MTLSFCFHKGIGSTRTGLHPIQEAIADAAGSQCGFCTPGMVMQMYNLLENNATPTAQQVEGLFSCFVLPCSVWARVYVFVSVCLCFVCEDVCECARVMCLCVCVCVCVCVFMRGV